MTEKTFEAGEVIFEAGQASEFAYIIKSGRARLCLETKRKTIEIDAGIGDIIGDTTVIFAAQKSADYASYLGTATALEPVTVELLPLKLLQAELAAASPLLRGWLLSFVQRVLKVIGQLAD